MHKMCRTFIFCTNFAMSKQIANLLKWKKKIKKEGRKTNCLYSTHTHTHKVHVPIKYAPKCIRKAMSSTAHVALAHCYCYLEPTAWKDKLLLAKSEFPFLQFL